MRLFDYEEKMDDDRNQNLYKLFTCQQCAEKRKACRPHDMDITVFMGECDFCHKLKCISSVDDWDWEICKPGLRLVRDD